MLSIDSKQPAQNFISAPKKMQVNSRLKKTFKGNYFTVENLTALSVNEFPLKKTDLSWELRKAHAQTNWRKAVGFFWEKSSLILRIAKSKRTEKFKK